MNRRHALTALATTAFSVLPTGARAAGPLGSVGVLSDEGAMPSLAGATSWLNSRPLTSPGLRGKVVLVDFWTYSCINWLRTLPYVRAWSERYKDQGLIVLGVHTPEFGFEKDVDNVRRAVRDMKVDYPVALDSDYAVWEAFDNHYWPALYIVDAMGRIRHHQFGEGNYVQSEAVIQRLLADAGADSPSRDPVRVDPKGIEAAADWSALRSAETYVGYARGERFASPGRIVRDQPHVYAAARRLTLDRWFLTGDWTVRAQFAQLNGSAGKVAFRFHARDLNLVMGGPATGPAVKFKVTLDGMPPADAKGLDVDDMGGGLLAEPRLYQLIRQRGAIADRTVEIEFTNPGVEAYSFTFG